MKYLMAAAAALCLTGGAAMAQAAQPYDQGYGPNGGPPPYGDQGPGDRGYSPYDRNANSGYGDQAPDYGNGQSYGAGDPSYGNDQTYGEDPANPGGNYQAYGGAQPYPVYPNYGAYGYRGGPVGRYVAPRGPRLGFFRGWRHPVHRARAVPIHRGRSFVVRSRHLHRR